MKLSIELVPSSCFYDNVRAIITKEQWDIVRKRVYDTAWHVCEICEGVGPKHPVEAHEIWHYDDENKIQSLYKILALCPDCHQVKHIGLARIHGKFDKALKHFMKINKMKKDKALVYIEEQFAIWEERSKHKWTLDISELKNYGVSQ